MPFRPNPFHGREELEEVFARHVSPGKLAAYRKYGFDAIMGPREGATFSARRADRFWQRKVRRRTYPFLLPGPIAR